MKLHTKDSLAEHVVRQWGSAYYWHKRNGAEDADKMGRCIEALKNGTLDAEMISKAFVEMGEASTIDSKTALVCLACLKKAVVEVIKWQA